MKSETSTSTGTHLYHGSCTHTLSQGRESGNVQELHAYLESDMEPCVDWVGKQLTCTLKGPGESYKGEVFTYDKATDTLVIKDHTVGLHEADYRFIKGKDVEPSSVKLEGSSRVPEPSPALEPETVERYACLSPLVVMRALLPRASGRQSPIAYGDTRAVRVRRSPRRALRSGPPLPCVTDGARMRSCLARIPISVFSSRCPG